MLQQTYMPIDVLPYWLWCGHRELWVASGEQMLLVENSSNIIAPKLVAHVAAGTGILHAALSLLVAWTPTKLPYLF